MESKLTLRNVHKFRPKSRAWQVPGKCDKQENEPGGRNKETV